MTEVILKEITKRFKTVTAVDGVSFEITDGEFFVLLGPTGAGKTTTLRLIAGLEKLDSGSIIIDGQAIDELTLNLKMRFDLGEVEYDEDGQIIVLEMREFLKALIHCSDTVIAELPVWKALAEVQENYTFVRMFLSLITMMWS